jgi:hypothetical protein
MRCILKYLSYYIFIVIILASHSAVAQPKKAIRVRSYSGGGICLKQQRWISMISNHIYLSREKVRTEYKLTNESNRSVKVELEFPVPVSPQVPAPSLLPYPDFKVWINGDVFPCPVELRAYVNGKEVTDLLNEFKIPIEGYDAADHPIDRLSKKQRDILVEAGAAYPPVTDSPGLHYARQWTIRKRYHWIQCFPARASLKIAFEYTPESNYSDMVFLHTDDNHAYELTPFGEGQGCIDKNLINALVKLSKFQATPSSVISGEPSYRIHTTQINYNLTTVDTFKVPIKSFELIIEKNPNELFSLCWDHPLVKIRNNVYRCTIKNFTPTSDIHLFFLKP